MGKALITMALVAGAFIGTKYVLSYVPSATPILGRAK